MITMVERENILSKIVLSSKDIQLLEDCTQQNASKIMIKCKEVYNGEILDRPNRITTKSYFKYCGCEKEYSKYHGGKER